MNARRETEFTIYLDQRPGELAGLLEAAAAASVHISAISTAEHKDRGVIRVLGTPVDALRHVMESLVESGVGPMVESEVISVPIDGRPRLIRDLAVSMADHRVNIRYCYFAPASNGDQARAVFRFDDIDAAEKVIVDLDWIGMSGEGESAA